MEEVLGRNFGLCIAYVVPGFVALWGASFMEPSLGVWLAAAGNSEATVGSFLYVLLASVTAGVTVSGVRWAMVDSIHHWMGLKRPRWRFSELQGNLRAFESMVEHHYRHYQFYANTLVAGSFTVVARRASRGMMAGSIWIEIAWVFLALIFFAASRDTLRNYYSRVGDLLKAEKGKCHGERNRSA
jgi:hypothetical protein